MAEAVFFTPPKGGQQRQHIGPSAKWPHLVLRGQCRSYLWGTKEDGALVGVSQPQNCPHLALGALPGPHTLQRHSLGTG